MTHEDVTKTLTVLENSGMINTPEKNLRSKIDSIVRSLENLSQKKLRIEFEIKRQKRSLARKREELKKTQKSTQAKAKIALESQSMISQFALGQKDLELQRLDSNLLQRSDQVLDT